jgi:phosphoserine phosphatase
MRDIRKECLDVLDRAIAREEATLAHLRHTQPFGLETDHGIRLAVKYLRGVREEILEKVKPDEQPEEEGGGGDPRPVPDP